MTSDIGRLYLGIDGGGSKCRALLADASGRPMASVTAGPANPFQDRAQALASIEAASRGALAQAGLGEADLSRVVAGVGLAGVNIPSVYAAMAAWQHPFAALHLTTDIHIACLGAHGGEDGAVIVAGTGSVGYVCVDGRSHNYGAHGFPFGDKASGAWLGLEALKAALLHLDGLGPQTALLPRIEGALGASGLELVAAMAGASSRDYGALAPLVLECADAGDPVAAAILADAAGYLDALARRLLSHGVSHFALLGGLGARLTNWLAADVQAALVTPRGQPDEGALRFARSRPQARTAALG
ncbi:BadF/BadG/BcrA/BcrD ATPase family protein [Parahaliea mediterranea]|uniref:BadF/BadG/BcrA/BcrD ATPase family protein n=1 Tax=Parahaliea mediterranea TaxID=651086 RepID=UPI001F4D72E1|nr:BadF/BadG/BcrA/BcrD ATPase family protein [Parahaliea mediterranea]